MYRVVVCIWRTESNCSLACQKDLGGQHQIEAGRKPTSKFLVIMSRVHSKTASKMRGTSASILSRSFVIIAANSPSTSASLRRPPLSRNQASLLENPDAYHSSAEQMWAECVASKTLHVFTK